MAGRPLKFETVEILTTLIDKYFQETKKEEWTITGLALALNTSRETLINYQEREEFFDTIKKAKDMVEHSYELDLKKKGHSGSIFALKNFDWSDKQQVDQKTEHSGSIAISWEEPPIQDTSDQGSH